MFKCFFFFFFFDESGTFNNSNTNAQQSHNSNKYVWQYDLVDLKICIVCVGYSLTARLRVRQIQKFARNFKRYVFIPTEVHVSLLLRNTLKFVDNRFIMFIFEVEYFKFT